jgi:hypothetical protein
MKYNKAGASQVQGYFTALSPVGLIVTIFNTPYLYSTVQTCAHMGIKDM